MDTLTYLAARGDPNGGCTKETCAPIYSVYGYRPSLGATIFFLVFFALSGVTYGWQGWKTKTRFFSIAMLIGSFSEVLGYVAKMILHNDPFSDVGFKMSIVLLTFAPAFYAAGIYYTLKHICLTFGASFSRLRPQLYTIIFISCDTFSIVLQAVGGALASASEDKALLDAGDNVMIAGLSTQVVTLIVFGILAADYGLAIYRNRAHLNSATAELRHSLRFKLFLVALWIAYFGILIRCAYRVAELCKGWGAQNTIMRNQRLFIGLDSVPVALAALVLNIWHPGWCFPKDQVQGAAVEEKRGQSNSSDEQMQSV